LFLFREWLMRHCNLEGVIKALTGQPLPVVMMLAKGRVVKKVLRLQGADVDFSASIGNWTGWQGRENGR
jgi:hypothetical protein